MDIKEHSLHSAVLTLDVATIRNAIDVNCHGDLEKNQRGTADVFHTFLQGKKPRELLACKQRRTIIYMLVNAGLDVNYQDQNGNTPLHIVISQHHGDIELSEPLFQGGAMFTLRNMYKHNIMDSLSENPQISSDVTEVFKKYSPGLWDAVDSDDLLSVRRLLNMWCRVDIQKDGMTLKEKALEMGTEHIIRLIKEIAPSMKFAHAVLAEDFKCARNILLTKEKVNLELKNLGDMCATPLFYAILQNDASMVRLLCEHGAKANSLITFEDEEIPVLFVALHSNADSEIVKHLVLEKEASLFKLSSLFYKGRNVLTHCVENDVSVAIVRHILHLGYSELVYLRNEYNKCARDIAFELGKNDVIVEIDEAVYDWYLDVNDSHRKALALNGYPKLRNATKDGVRACEVVQSMETSSPQAQFDSQLLSYLEQINSFHSAVKAGDIEQVKELIHFDSPNARCFSCCLVDSRAKGDGQPPLHKALLHGHLEVLQYIIETLQTTEKKIDAVRDQKMRTVLHYAYAMPRSRYLVNLLMDNGASEFTMDKDFRSPLVFKDYKDQPEMKKLLLWHRDQLYSSPEPDPWSNRIPPIILSLRKQREERNEPFKLKGPANLQPRVGHISPEKCPLTTYQRSTWTAYCAIL